MDLMRSMRMRQGPLIPPTSPPAHARRTHTPAYYEQRHRCVHAQWVLSLRSYVKVTNRRFLAMTHGSAAAQFPRETNVTGEFVFLLPPSASTPSSVTHVSALSSAALLLLRTWAA